MANHSHADDETGRSDRCERKAGVVVIRREGRQRPDEGHQRQADDDQRRHVLGVRHRFAGVRPGRPRWSTGSLGLFMASPSAIPLPVFQAYLHGRTTWRR